MRYLCIPIVLFLLTGCENAEKRRAADREIKDPYDCALGLVGHHPLDPAALDAAIEECDFHDHVIWTAIGRLIKDGKVRTTPEGLIVVPRAEWPHQPEDLQDPKILELQEVSDE